jgi:hypothetical protein
VKRSEVKTQAVIRTVNELRETSVEEFSTTDISRAESCTRAHGQLAQEDNYDGMVGKYLGEASKFLSIEATGSRRANAALWRFTPSTESSS